MLQVELAYRAARGFAENEKPRAIKTRGVYLLKDLRYDLSQLCPELYCYGGVGGSAWCSLQKRRSLLAGPLTSLTFTIRAIGSLVKDK